MRATPHVNVVRWSPHKSTRGGAHPTLIAVHATAGHNRPGVVDLESLGGWGANPLSQVSWHVATDNEGHSLRTVRDAEKAWHVAGYNRMALGIEQVLPGDGSEVTRAMLEETARWVARWSKLHGIPIQKARVTAGGVILRPGVIRHSELGVLGGNHSDPGGYDMHAMLELARGFRARI